MSKGIQRGWMVEGSVYSMRGKRRPSEERGGLEGEGVDRSGVGR